MSREIELKEGQGVGCVDINSDGNFSVRSARVTLTKLDDEEYIHLNFGGEANNWLFYEGVVQLALPELEHLIIEEVEERNSELPKLDPSYEREMKVLMEELLKNNSYQRPNTSVSEINMFLNGLFAKLKLRK